MTRTERLYRIDQLLRNRRAVSRRELLAALECSQATLTRDLEYLRSQLNAPILFDGELGAYRLDEQACGPAYALPAGGSAGPGRAARQGGAALARGGRAVRLNCLPCMGLPDAGACRSRVANAIIFGSFCQNWAIEHGHDERLPAGIAQGIRRPASG